MALPHFELPPIEDNDFGWGPSDIPTQFKDIPFAPFNKNDRLGKISDWTAQGQKSNQRGGRFPQQFGSGTGQFQYKHEDDESSFSLVDNRPKPKNRFRTKTFVRKPQNNWYNNNNNNNNNKNRWNNRGRGRQNNRYGQNRRWGYNYDNRDLVRDPSVEISESWPLVASWEFSELNEAPGYRVATPD
jgi:translation initiation factor 3 subunit D